MIAPQPTDPRVYRVRQQRHWCGPSHEAKALPGLDDRDCVKRFPPLFDRGFTCPAVWPERTLRGFDAPPVRAEDAPIAHELSAIVPSVAPHHAKVAVVVVRRDASGRSRVRYLGNGAERVAHQPWSSSKVLAAAHAAARMRSQRDNIGLDATDVRSTWQLSDLLTIVAAYDSNASRPGVSSNALGAYMHRIGGHAAANEYLHRVIGASANETFGGDYGAPVPAQLGDLFAPYDGIGPPVSIAEDAPPSPAIPNSMSCLTMAEWMRRIVQASPGMPGRPCADHNHSSDHDNQDVHGADATAMLYGAERSELFPGLQWGGLSMGTDVYLQRAVDNLTRLDARAHGRWRVFSKLGAGLHTDSPVERGFQITLNAAACFPVLDPTRSRGASPQPVPGRGLEFALSAFVVGPADVAADDAMQSLVTNVTRFLLSHYDGGTL